MRRHDIRLAVPVALANRNCPIRLDRLAKDRHAQLAVASREGILAGLPGLERVPDCQRTVRPLRRQQAEQGRRPALPAGRPTGQIPIFPAINGVQYRTTGCEALSTDEKAASSVVAPEAIEPAGITTTQE